MICCGRDYVILKYMTNIFCTIKRSATNATRREKRPKIEIEGREFCIFFEIS